MRRSWGVALACLLIAGCNNGVEGEALADAPTAPFDPCSIPADAIEATGLARAANGTGWGEYDIANWSRCVWEYESKDEWYSLTALVSVLHTASEMATNPGNTRRTDIRIAGRSATRFRLDSDEMEIRCGLTFDTTEGVVVLLTRNEGASWTFKGNACDVLVRHAADLSGYFPPSN